MSTKIVRITMEALVGYVDKLNSLDKDNLYTLTSAPANDGYWTASVVSERREGR